MNALLAILAAPARLLAPAKGRRRKGAPKPAETTSRRYDTNPLEQIP